MAFVAPALVLNISKVKEVAFTKYPALGVTVNSTYLELLKLVPQLDPPTLKVVELLLLQDGPVTDAALNVRFGATLLAALVEGVQAVPLKIYLANASEPWVTVKVCVT